MTELADRLEGGVPPYVCLVDGEFVGDIVSVEHGEEIYRWQGGVHSDVDPSANDLLDWHVVPEGTGVDGRGATSRARTTPG